jgi:hypothetical protein
LSLVFNVVLALPRDLEGYVHLENSLIRLDIFSADLHYQHDSHCEMLSCLLWLMGLIFQ